MANSGVVVVISGQDNTDKVFKQIEANLQRTTHAAHETESALAQLGERAKKALEYFAVYEVIRETLTAMKELVAGSLELGETLEKASKKTGLSVETLSTLHYAAGVTSSDFDSMSAAIGKLGKNIGDAADGNKKAESFLQAIGLNAKQLVTQSDGAEIAFKRLAQTLANTTNSSERLRLATGLLGKAGQEQIDLLVKIGNNWDYYKQKATEAGQQLTGETAEALAHSNAQLKDMQQRIQGAGLAFTTGLVPGINAMLSILSGGKNNMDAFVEFGSLVGRGLGAATAVVYGFAAGLAKIGEVSSTIGLNFEGAKKYADFADSFDQKAKDSAFFAVNGYQHGWKESRAEHEAEKGEGGDGKGFHGTGDISEASKMEAARKALDAAQLRLDEQMAQLRAQLAKAAQEKNLAQLEADHKKNLISDQAFYEKKLAIEKAALDQQRQAAIDKQTEIDTHIGKLDTDAKKQGGAVAVEDQAKILELRTKRLALDGEIAKINADAAKAEIDAAIALDELKKKRLARSDELAAKREQISGRSTTARLKQSADTYSEQRESLVANYGEGSSEVSNAAASFANGQGQIRLKGAEEQSGLDVARVTSERQALADAEARGTTTTLAAQRQRIALDAEEAQALQPVLEAYQQLAATGDLQASEKVLELRTRIAELKNPVDEVSAHIRESFDGAFESLFENLDQGVKGFENFSKSVERILEQAAYKRFLEPLVQKGLNSLIPSTNKTPAYGDPGIGGLGPVPNPGTDIGGGAVKTALGAAGSLLGIPGLGGLGKTGGGKTITIMLENAGAPLNIKDVATQGGVDKDSVETIIKNSFDEGGLMRSLLTGFGIG